MDIRTLRLKEAFEKSELTQTEICAKTGINKGALSSYLSGRYFPKQQTIEKLADVLNVSIPYLMGWEEPPTDSQPYYLDPDAAAFAQEISESPGLRALFSATRGVKEEDLRFMAEMAARFKKEAGED